MVWSQLQKLFESWRRRGGMNAPGGLALRNRPLATMVLLVANATWWLAAELIGSTRDPLSLLDFGANYGPLVAGGEYWRLLSSIFLHIGIMHLMLNSLGLLIYGMLLERVFGSSRFVLIYISAGLAGSTASFVANPLAISAGASGAIFGLLGALAACFLTGRGPLGRGSRRDAAGIGVLVAINLAFGFMVPGIDNWAHIGGLVMGFALGGVLASGYETYSVYTGLVDPSARSRPGSSRRVLLALPPIALLLVVGVWLGTQGVAGGLDRAERLLEDQQYAEALLEIQQVIDQGWDTGEAYLLRGIVRERLGDDAGAVADLRLALLQGLTAEDRSRAIALMVSMREGG